MTEIREDRAATTPRPPDAARRVARRAPASRTVLAVASLGVLVAFLDVTVVNIAFPDIVRSFAGTSLAELSWVLSAYNIVFAAFLVPAGRIADVIGRRRTFVAGLWVFTAASALCALAPSPGTLIAARVLQALGAAALVPASLSLVMEGFPPDRRRHAVALWTAVAALAAGIGPSLGGLLVSVADWRLVFLINLPIGIVAIVLARRALVESRAPGRRRVPDMPGALLLAVSVGLLVLAITESTTWGATDLRTLACFGGALALGALLVRRSTAHRDPILDLELLRIPSFAIANGLGVVASAGFFAYTLSNVLFLTAIWGYSAVEAGLALTPGPFVAAAVAGPTSRLVERIGHRPVLLVGGLIWGAGTLWLASQVGPRPAFVSEWLPGMAILGVGAGTLFANLSATAAAAAPGERFGTATGLNNVARQIGAALGVAGAIAIVGTPRSLAEGLAAFDDVWTAAAVCLAGAGIGCLAIGRLAGAEPPSLREASRAVRAPEPTSTPPPAPAARRPTRLAAAASASPTRESVADFLAAAPLLGGLTAAQREALAARATPVRLPLGDWLFQAGDPGDAMYVLRAGRLEVVGSGPEAPVLRILGRGDAVGELALLADAPRSASVRAARDCDLVAVAREDFERVLDEQPGAALAIARTLAGQLRESRGAGGGRRPVPVTVALVALGDGLPFADLAAGLETALGRNLRLARLDGGDGASGDGVARFGPLLDRAEAANDQVLLVGGDARLPDPWTAFCLQQADRVLVVAGPGDRARAEGLPPALRGCDLVAYDVAPGSGGVAGLADALDPATTHAWRPATLEADLARAARRLSGRAVGVVLSGGGARAFAHVGVLEELASAGIVIDRISGVSMGALVGGLAAAGMDVDEIDATLYEEWVRGRPLSDYTTPKYALIRGYRFEEMLTRVFGPVAIEELACSFTCASADLRRSELVIHRHGSLGDQVGTSMALPILAPPQVRGRRLLIDGSLIDNLPVGPLADTGEGPVIAVDVKAGVERDRHAGRPSRPPGRGSRRFAGGGPAPPRLGETAMRVLLLATSNTTEAARRDADLLIAPRDPGVGLLEFHQLDRARESGRAAARAALDAAAPDVIERLSGARAP